MSSLWSLFNGKKRKLVLSEQVILTSAQNTSQNLITVEATLSFKLMQGLNITDHPVEKGSAISDMAQIKLKEVSIEGIITESPLTIENAIASVGTGMLGKAVGGTVGSIATGVASKLTDSFLNGDGQQRVLQAKQILDGIVNDKRLISLTIKNHVVNSLMMTDLTYNDEVSNGNSLVFSATLKEVRIVSGKTEQRKVSGMKKSAVAKVDKGVAQVKALPVDKTAKIGESLLHKIFY